MTSCAALKLQKNPEKQVHYNLYFCVLRSFWWFCDWKEKTVLRGFAAVQC